MFRFAQNKSTNAFTLSEVLITLGIIGVVASMVIPALMNNIQNQQNIVAWKKVYSTFSNATQSIINDNGGTLEGLLDNTDDSVRKLYKPYLRVVKPCLENAVNGICWHNDSDWKLLNGSDVPASVSGVNVLLNTGSSGDILSDGTLVRYMGDAWSCKGTFSYCAYVLVDVNGFNKPNVVGKDIFGMKIYTDRIRPFGVSGSAEGTSCTSSDNGFSCSSYYLKK